MAVLVCGMGVQGASGNWEEGEGIREGQEV